MISMEIIIIHIYEDTDNPRATSRESFPTSVASSRSPENVTSALFLNYAANWVNVCFRLRVITNDLEKAVDPGSALFG